MDNSIVKIESTNDIYCRECGEIFKEWTEFLNHREISHNLYTCKSCTKEETSLLDFEHHLQIHGGLKLFKCIICNEHFSFLSELNDHLPSHMPGFIESKELGSTDSKHPLFSIVEVKTEKNDDDGNNFDCNDLPDLPQTDTNVQDNFTETMKIDKKKTREGKRKGSSKIPKLTIVPEFKLNTFQRDPCEATPLVAKQPVKRKCGRPRKPIEELPKIFKCPQCPYITKTNTNLKLHIRTHSTEKPFECALCGVKYKVMFSLESHMLMKHNPSKKKTEICSICGKGFYMLRRLQVHMKIHQSQRERYPCTVCGKTYSMKNSLNLHMEKHPTDKQERYPCPKCEKVFEFRQSMMYHYRRHFEQKKFACDWESCNYRTRIQSLLLVHKRTHTGERPFACSRCTSAFATNKALKHHIMQVHEPPTLQCKFCDMVFHIKPSLNSHLRRVHFERTIPCPVCNKKYGSKGDVTRHMKDSHSGHKVPKKKLIASQKILTPL
ncbi:gastrula zinc finger protein XlCGF26.1-like [Phlebotomus papatasi]|uniref:gastrula zinc finger protein XlCGF26.1-like n=1 Tax=Phlebotomus papatasi TaxID=29031 RepID=UPI0024833521|nr:gastrula zinc finger protein XlCGF26.1-like [Phlebotomus papatasi]